jgi:hypothetical protein
VAGAMEPTRFSDMGPYFDLLETLAI